MSTPERVLLTTPGVRLRPLPPSQTPFNDPHPHTLVLTTHHIHFLPSPEQAVDPSPPPDPIPPLPLHRLDPARLALKPAKHILARPTLDIPFRPSPLSSSASPSPSSSTSTSTSVPASASTSAFTSAPAPASALSFGSGFGTWTCTICGFRNDVPARTSSTTMPPSKRTCRSCGVPSLSSLPSLPVPSPTTHSRPRESNACPACTFLNHPALLSCELCQTSLCTTDIGRRPSLPPPPPTTAVQIGWDWDRVPGLNLTFLQGGEKAIHVALEQALKDRAWLGRADTQREQQGGGVGIQGVVERAQRMDLARTDELAAAFADLASLQLLAQRTISLARDLYARTDALTPSAARLTPEQKLQRQNLASLALVDSPELDTLVHTARRPKTMAASSSNDTVFYTKLASELARVLQSYASASNTNTIRNSTPTEPHYLIPLDQAWCIWNRARGVALLPPQTLLRTLDYLQTPSSKYGLHVKQLKSGIKVLHTDHFTSHAIAAHVRRALAANDAPVTLLELALEAQVPLQVMQELLDELQTAESWLVRDDAPSGTQWFLTSTWGS